MMFVTVLLGVIVTPTIASAKLPFFELEVTPRRPAVGERITIRMTCHDDARHTVPWSACLGAGGTMAWIHPLDGGGRFDRDDWIDVVGHATRSGSTRAWIVLTEPGSYDVLPLFRRWGYDHGRGFPDPVRIEVGRRAPIVPLAAGVGIAGAGLVVAVWRGRPGRRDRDRSKGPASTSEINANGPPR